MAHTIKGIIPYNSLSENLGNGIREVIDPGAFKRVGGRDVKAMIGHDANKVIGSANAGTLTLTDTREGLVCECALPDTTYANDLFASIERGDLTSLSFGFDILDCEYDRDGVRHLKDVDLYEVSFGVAFPAYSGAVVFERRHLVIDELKALMAKDELTEDELAALKEVQGLLNDKFPPPRHDAGDAGDGKREREETEVVEVKEEAKPAAPPPPKTPPKPAVNQELIDAVIDQIDQELLKEEADSE